MQNPQRNGLYRMSTLELAELRKQIDEILSNGFSPPSSNPWGAPFILVSKKDDALPLRVDYRALKRLTIKNGYPLTKIDEIFDQLTHAEYFAKNDLHSGYHQIRLENKSVPLTTFRTK